MDKLFHILYVDSDPLTAGQVLMHFNPPKNMPIKLLNKLNKKLNKEEQYNFLFTYCDDYKEALRRLLDHNYDPLQKQRGITPFDTILFEIKVRSEPGKYSWLDFIGDVSQFGIHRLGLSSGFLAFGSLASEATKDTLMSYGVRAFIKKPFTTEQLGIHLRQYLETLEGSRIFYVEERNATLDTGQEITRRVLRYINARGRTTGIHLASLEKERKKKTLLLRNSLDEEAQCDLLAGELFEEVAPEKESTVNPEKESIVNTSP